MRVTDEATLNVVEMVLGEINQELVGLINKFGAKAVGLSGQDGRFIHARRMTLPPDEPGGAAPDVGLVGEVESIDPDVIHLLDVARLHSGDHAHRRRRGRHRLSHQLRRVRGRARADAACRETDPHDQRARHPRPRRQARVRADARARPKRCCATAWCPPDLRPRVAAALSAVREGVRSVHIIDGGVASALLLEVLTNSGIGTAMRSDAGPHFLADSRSYFAGTVDG